MGRGLLSGKEGGGYLSKHIKISENSVWTKNFLHQILKHLTHRIIDLPYKIFYNTNNIGKIKDLTGKRFFRFEVLELASKSSAKNGRYWKCKCDCGTIKLIPTSRLHPHY